MFALAAVIAFVVAFIMALMGQNTGKVDLVVLGFVFVALHLLTGYTPWTRRP